MFAASTMQGVAYCALALHKPSLHSAHGTNVTIGSSRLWLVAASGATLLLRKACLGRCEVIIQHKSQSRPPESANLAASVLHHLDLQEGCKHVVGEPLYTKPQGPIDS